MKRTTLTKNLNELIDRVKNTFLPINIQRVFVHGSYFRGDELPGDLDIFFCYTVKDQWKEWHTTIKSLNDHYKTLSRYHIKGLSVSEAIIQVSSEIKNWNIPKDWLTCVSWTAIFRSFPADAFCWEKISRRLLTRELKGVKLQNVSIKNCSHVFGRLYLYAEMPAFLVWSAEEPARVVLTPNDDEFQGYLQLENKILLKNLNDAQIECKFGRALIERMLMQYPKDKLGVLTLRVFNDHSIIEFKVSEELLREELRKIGLPENWVFATGHKSIDHRYKLAKNIAEQKDFEQEARCDIVTNNTKKTIVSILRDCLSKEESYGLNCRVMPQRCERSCVLKADGTNLKCSEADLESGLVSVSVEKPDNMLEEEFKKQWALRGFEVSGTSEYLYAGKTFDVRMDLSRKEIRERIINELKVQNK
ncbi:MAG: hypothetical protein FWD52_03460 [Candidatus Bathyarchaeota archaeon]|nr:hypothetical protein [Candidatus Termiticorpusculum sp.]